jgi:hypothetical protein
LQAYLRWPNASNRHPDVLVAQRRERAGVVPSPGPRDQPGDRLRSPHGRCRLRFPPHWWRPLASQISHSSPRTAPRSVQRSVGCRPRRGRCARGVQGVVDVQGAFVGCRVILARHEFSPGPGEDGALVLARDLSGVVVADTRVVDTERAHGRGRGEALSDDLPCAVFLTTVGAARRGPPGQLRALDSRRPGQRARERRSSCGTGDCSWEKPTKIFSQISPKRSPGTTQGPDPLCGSGP